MANFFHRIQKRTGLLRKSRAIKQNQSGQAVVEYTLLLVVVVSLALALRGVFASLNSFMSDYIGEYVVCLMEYGELPSLGVQNTDLKQHKEGTGKKCSFRQFAGVASFGAGGGGSGGGSSASGNGSGNSGGDGNSSNKGKSGNASDNKNNNSSSDSEKSGSASKRGSSGSSSSGRGSAASRTGSSSNQRLGQSAPSSSTADNQTVGDSQKIKVTDEDELGGSRSGNDLYSSSSRSRRRSGRENASYRPITGVMEEQLKKQIKTSVRSPSSSVIATSQDDEYRRPAARRAYVPPPATKLTEESQDDSFAFGSFLKWIIIAGLIIAFFILFGGQILNYSNGEN